MKEKFTIEILSDLDYEGMIIIISYNNNEIAKLNYERGVNNVEVVLLSAKILPISFPVDDYLYILQKAKALAVKCAREDIEHQKEV